MRNEQKFIAEVGKFEFISQNMEAQLARLDAWRESLTQALSADRAPIKGLKPDTALAAQVDEVHAQVRRGIEAWSQQWSSRVPAQMLADSLGDQAILLIFGKVNAGKSSFCNLLVDRFAVHGKQVQHFYIETNRIVHTQEQFKEGVTETTSRIQGVLLGEKLVLLDTPGLHSVTVENGELTRRFTDSADAVLWLTSSTSPGQVQELDELCRELEGGKPLQPVVTKSDVIDEDEVAGKILKTLRNKTPDNRTQQEVDVAQRVAEKLMKLGLKPELLRPPVSVSVYTARDRAQTTQAMDDAGFARLYAELLKIVEAALVYKRRKATEVMLNHLKVKVLGALREQVLPRLGDLQQSSQDASSRLEQRRQQITSSVARVVVGALPSILEKHESARDVKAVLSQISTTMVQELTEQVREALGDYVVTMNESLAKLSPDIDLGFEEHTIDVEVHKGAAARTAVGAAGAAAGAWAGAEAGAAIGTAVFAGLGTAVGGMIGGIIGGLFGGAAGSKGGEYFEESEIQRRVVGVSYERLLAVLESEVRKNLPKLVGNVVQQCRDAIDKVMKEIQRLEDIVHTHEHTLVKLKEEIYDAV